MSTEQRGNEVARYVAEMDARFEREFRSFKVKEVRVERPEIKQGEKFSVNAILETSDSELFQSGKPEVMTKLITADGAISDETTPVLEKRDGGMYQLRGELEGPPFPGTFYVAIVYGGGRVMEKVPLTVTR